MTNRPRKQKPNPAKSCINGGLTKIGLDGETASKAIGICPDTLYRKLKNPDLLTVENLRRLTRLGAIATPEDLWAIINWR